MKMTNRFYGYKSFQRKTKIYHPFSPVSFQLSFREDRIFLLHKQILKTIKLVCTWHIRCLDSRYLSSHVLHKPLTRLLVQPLSLS